MFQLRAYLEDKKNDAWDIHYKGGNHKAPGQRPRARIAKLGPVQIVESGPVRATVKIVYRLPAGSTANMYLSLRAGTPTVFSKLEVDWRAKDTFLKVAFPLALSAKSATYEIPYAAIDRTTMPTTKAQRAQWEVSGHRWASMVDRSGAFGASLLNREKYGYSASGSELELSLLRGPSYPDPQADQGGHEIKFALYPHRGNWKAAQTHRAAAEYNSPLVPHYPHHRHKGRWGRRKGSVSTSAVNVNVTVVKPGRQQREWVLRVVETSGRATTTRVRLPRPIHRAWESDLNERKLHGMAGINRNNVTVSLKPFEVKTVTVQLQAPRKQTGLRTN